MKPVINIIKEIPDIPDQLKNAAAAGKLIPFIGAGVSMLAGAPSWGTFANKAINFFVKEGDFHHGQVKQIESLSPRVKLSVALSMQEKFNKRIIFDDIFKVIDERKLDAGRRIYGNLSKLSNIFVTTNYDKWLDEGHQLPNLDVSEVEAASSKLQIPRTPIHKKLEILPEKLSIPNTVIHLHGSLRVRGL